jgi:hypothetical protein
MLVIVPNYIYTYMQLGEFRHSKGEFTLRGLYGREDWSGGQNKLDVKQLLLVARVSAAGRVDTDKKGKVALEDSLSEAMAKNLADAKNAVEAKAAAKAARAAAKCGGLREEELQFLVCLLGEHLNEEQVQPTSSCPLAPLDFPTLPHATPSPCMTSPCAPAQVHAILSSLDFSATPVLPFEAPLATPQKESVAKILKFMNPLLHRQDVKQLGSIWANDPTKVEEVEDWMLDDEGNSTGSATPMDWALHGVQSVLRGVDDIRMSGQRRRAEKKARKAREKEQFTTWFDAMDNNQTRMQQELSREQMHFG